MSYARIKKIAGAIALLIAIVYAILTGIDQGQTDQYFEQLEGKAVAIDPTITFEYGKPMQVAHVSDGDTIQLVNGDFVRYIGIDTPESVDPRKAVQCYAHEASAENKRLVQGQYVVLEKDTTERDKYGRLLGYVYLADGTFVNKKLVEGGFAFSYAYKPDTGRQEELSAAELAAKTASLGLWAECTVRTLSSGRKQTNDVGI